MQQTRFARACGVLQSHCGVLGCSHRLYQVRLKLPSNLSVSPDFPLSPVLRQSGRLNHPRNCLYSLDLKAVVENVGVIHKSCELRTTHIVRFP